MSPLEPSAHASTCSQRGLSDGQNYPEDPFAFITAFLKRDYPHAKPDVELNLLRAEHQTLTKERDAVPVRVLIESILLSIFDDRRKVRYFTNLRMA